jgi:hypothetical protein
MAWQDAITTKAMIKIPFRIWFDFGLRCAGNFIPYKKLIYFFNAFQRYKTCLFLSKKNKDRNFTKLLPAPALPAPAFCSFPLHLP